MFCKYMQHIKYINAQHIPALKFNTNSLHRIKRVMCNLACVQHDEWGQQLSRDLKMFVFAAK